MSSYDSARTAYDSTRTALMTQPGPCMAQPTFLKCKLSTHKHISLSWSGQMTGQMDGSGDESPGEGRPRSTARSDSFASPAAASPRDENEWKKEKKNQDRNTGGIQNREIRKRMGRVRGRERQGRQLLRSEMEEC